MEKTPAAKAGTKEEVKKNFERFHFTFLDLRMLESEHPDHLRLGGARHRLGLGHRQPLDQRRRSGQTLLEKFLQTFERRSQGRIGGSASGR